MTAYAASGAVRADIAGLDLTERRRSSAFATVHWLVRGADGTVVKNFRTTHHLQRAEESLRILSHTKQGE
jgi:hypothetical protein